MYSYIRYFPNQTLRVKLLVGYTSILILSSLLGGIIIYSQVKKNIERNIESELNNTTNVVLNMVQSAVNISIKNHLRAAAERNREIVENIYKRYEAGIITEEEAKTQARRILFSQTIGKTGYIYCVNSKGIAIEHPNPGIRGQRFLYRRFVQNQIQTREGYLEYDWQNPEETTKRPKALYMTYFKPWDWIISVTSYREEFSELITVSDFRESILGLKFGKTGYSYVFNTKGDLIIHPTLSGNAYNQTDETGHYFVRELCERKRGKIRYSWKNPGEKTYRDKLVIFNYIAELDWIVASTSYLDENYTLLNTLRNIIIATLAGTLLLILPVSIWISTSIILPLRSLMERFAKGASGDLTVRMPVKSGDEIGQLTRYFNNFMEKLEIFSANLQAEIHEHQRTGKALRLSEEMFSKAFRCSPSGIFIATIKEGRLINVNTSFLKFTGHTLFEVFGKDLMALQFFNNRAQGRNLMKEVRDGGSIRNREIEFRKASGEVRLGEISAERLELWGNDCILAALEDHTESKRLEREIMDISERERRKIAFELHDDLCPQLIGIEVLSKVLKMKLESKGIEEAASLEKIRLLIIDAIDKAKQLSRGLCPVNLADHGFDSSLDELGDYVSNVFGITCHITCYNPRPFDDNAVATHVYYIVHEAVHNAVKHSRANNIFINLNVDKLEGIILTIRDDGKGIPENPETGGLGLRIMKYRAKRIGAALDIKRSPNGGTLVSLGI